MDFFTKNNAVDGQRGQVSAFGAVIIGLVVLGVITGIVVFLISTQPISTTGLFASPSKDTQNSLTETQNTTLTSNQIVNTDSNVNDSVLQNIITNVRVCDTNAEKCDGTTFFSCVDNNWVNKGKITGKCNYSETASSANNNTKENSTEENNNSNSNGDTNTDSDGNSVTESDTDLNNTLDTNNNLDSNSDSNSNIDSNTNTVSQNEEVDLSTPTFTKDDYATGSDALDCITENVCLTRLDTQGLFNSVSESAYTDNSPIDTEWHFGDFCKSGLSYATWVEAANHNPKGTIGVPACVHLIADDLYFNIKFYSWSGSDSGGGFSYARTDAVSLAD